MRNSCTRTSRPRNYLVRVTRKSRTSPTNTRRNTTWMVDQDSASRMAANIVKVQTKREVEEP
jgi:hypothetical protein